MILALLQARMSSTRLPGKVLKPILREPMLARQIERIRRSARIGTLVVATSTDASDDVIASLCESLAVPCARGSLNDVLDRFYRAAAPYDAEHIVRITGDCPVIDSAVIDATIEFFLERDVDYASNAVGTCTFPDGLDVEIFRRSVLEIAWREAVLPSHREHVTPFIYHHPERFQIATYTHTTNLSHHRWTVDEPEDLEFITKIFEELYPSNPHFGMHDILALLERRPDFIAINAHIGRNEGLQKALTADAEYMRNIS